MHRLSALEMNDSIEILFFNGRTFVVDRVFRRHDFRTCLVSISVFSKVYAVSNRFTAARLMFGEVFLGGFWTSRDVFLATKVRFGSLD